MHDQPNFVAFIALWPQSGEPGGVYSEVDSKLGYAHASAGGFEHHHGAADFHGDTGDGDGQAADFFCVAGCDAVLVGDDIVAVQALAVCCYFVFFQVGFCREQAQLVLGQVAGYEVGVGRPDEVHCNVGFAPGGLVQLCCGAPHDADIGEVTNQANIM